MGTGVLNAGRGSRHDSHEEGGRLVPILCCAQICTPTRLLSTAAATSATQSAKTPCQHAFCSNTSDICQPTCYAGGTPSWPTPFTSRGSGRTPSRRSELGEHEAVAAGALVQVHHRQACLFGTRYSSVRLAGRNAQSLRLLTTRPVGLYCSEEAQPASQTVPQLPLEPRSPTPNPRDTFPGEFTTGAKATKEVPFMCKNFEAQDRITAVRKVGSRDRAFAGEKVCVSRGLGAAHRTLQPLLRG